VTGLVVSMLGAMTALAAPATGHDVPTRHAAATATSGAGRDVARRAAGAGKPTRVCGTLLLDGPSTRPHGAKVVRTTQDLPNLVDRSAPGTTFYLLPGVHTFGDDQFDQIGPKDGDTFIGAPGAVVDGRGVNRYAFGGDAERVTISYLTIQDFGRGIDDNNGEGVVNHDQGNDWYVHHTTITRNAGAGLFLSDGSRAVRNCLLDNGEYGFSSFEFGGVENIVLRGNEIAGNNAADWESISPGCGCSGGGKFWDTRNAKVVDNYVHHNHGAGLWADTNDVGFLFEGNYISDNDGEGIFYEISYNATIRRNTFLRNGWKIGRAEGAEQLPLAAIYLSEAGSDVRAGQLYGRHLRIAGNRFIDNWAGIMAWENPDRFAGSPVNSSSGYSTLVNPKVATVENCSDPDLIGTDPYFDDCRWKTQHLRVVNNEFTFDPTHIPGCVASLGCGFMGLASNVGTVPDWSPYQGYVVPDNISLHQDNVWRNNVYAGPWRFVIRQLGSGQVSWRGWRSAPWHQDAGSTRQ
jgi:parallel beta-helix repeat protein